MQRCGEVCRSVTQGALAFTLLVSLNCGGSKKPGALSPPGPSPTPSPKLDAVQGLSQAPVTRGHRVDVTLTWSKVASATSYDVYRATSATEPGTLVGSTTSPATFVADLDACAPTYFYVVAKSAAAASLPSARVGSAKFLGPFDCWNFVQSNPVVFSQLVAAGSHFYRAAQALAQGAPGATRWQWSADGHNWKDLSPPPGGIGSLRGSELGIWAINTALYFSSDDGATWAKTELPPGAGPQSAFFVRPPGTVLLIGAGTKAYANASGTGWAQFFDLASLVPAGSPPMTVNAIAATPLGGSNSIVITAATDVGGVSGWQVDEVGTIHSTTGQVPLRLGRVDGINYGEAREGVCVPGCFIGNNSEGVVYSKDGLAWSKATFSAPTPASTVRFTYDRVVYGANSGFLFAVFSEQNGRAGYLDSTDGATLKADFAQPPLNEPPVGFAAAFDSTDIGTKFMTLLPSGSALTLSQVGSVLAWGSDQPTPTTTLQSIVGGNGFFIASGSSGLFYRSTDHGLSWAPLTIDSDPKVQSVFGFAHMASDGMNSVVIFLSTGEVYYSRDGGVNWATVDPTSAGVTNYTEATFVGDRFMAIARDNKIYSVSLADAKPKLTVLPAKNPALNFYSPVVLGSASGKPIWLTTVSNSASIDASLKVYFSSDAGSAATPDFQPATMGTGASSSLVNAESVAFANSVFAAIDPVKGIIYTSVFGADGWTAQPQSNDYRGKILALRDAFVLSHSQGFLASTDGVTFTPHLVNSNYQTPLNLSLPIASDGTADVVLGRYSAIWRN